MKLIASRSHHRKKWPLAALIIVDLAVFGGSNPRNVPSIGLFLGFLLLVVSFYALLLGGLKLLAWYGGADGRPAGRRQKRFIRLAAGLFGGLVALQSIGELSGRDMLVILPLAFLAYMYISYGNGASSVGHGKSAEAHREAAGLTSTAEQGI